MFFLKQINCVIETKYKLSDWAKKKFVWRYSFYFSIVFILVLIGIIFTILISILIDYDVYFNHNCPSVSIKNASANYMTMIIFASIMCGINFIFSRLTYLYSNYTNGEFFNLGFYCTIIGFLIKYISWLLSLVYISWIIFLIYNLLTIFLSPKSWCSPTYNAYGMDAVNNCIMVNTRSAGCDITNDVPVLKGSEKCNDFNVLKIYNFLYFVRSSLTNECTLKDKPLCDYFLEYRKNRIPMWNNFPQCSGNNVDLREEFFTADPKLLSYFYLLSVCYVLYWNVTALVIFSSFIYIKFNTPIDASFMLSIEKVNLFIRITRIFDIWK